MFDLLTYFMYLHTWGPIKVSLAKRLHGETWGKPFYKSLAG